MTAIEVSRKKPVRERGQGHSRNKVDKTLVRYMLQGVQVVRRGLRKGCVSLCLQMTSTENSTKHFISLYHVLDGD